MEHFSNLLSLVKAIFEKQFSNQDTGRAGNIISHVVNRVLHRGNHFVVYMLADTTYYVIEPNDNGGFDIYSPNNSSFKRAEIEADDFKMALDEYLSAPVGCTSLSAR